MNKPLLILPVENQVRELDAKLLLACIAVEYGYRSIIGFKSRIDSRLGRFAPGIYFAKSLTNRNVKVFRTLRKLGHSIVAWDEESLVHYPPEIYYARRLGMDALGYMDHIIAWGDANRILLEGCPDFRSQGKIQVLGNPRVDLLRPELSGYFAGQVEGLREQHGDFILVNTNFGSINCYDDNFNLFRWKDGELVQGRGSRLMPADYAKGLFHYRTQIFEKFKKIIPEIAAALPETKIIVRPHPAEDHAAWREYLAPVSNVAVIQDGNVIPWLRASKCLIHNGCTTAIEGFILGTKIISYVPIEDESYEFALPNKFGARAGDLGAVVEAVRGIDARASADETLNGQLLARSICSLEGKLSSERILEFFRVANVSPGSNFLGERLAGKVEAEFRMMKRRIKRWADVSRDYQGFTRHRFPELTIDAVQDRLDRLTSVLDRTGRVRVKQREADIFEVFG
jgi:surface carbohydrate biosynthesis protein